MRPLCARCTPKEAEAVVGGRTELARREGLWPIWWFAKRGRVVVAVEFEFAGKDEDFGLVFEAWTAWLASMLVFTFTLMS